MCYSQNISIRLSAFIFALFPLLNIYATGIPGFSIGELLMVFVFFWKISRLNQITVCRSLFVLLAFYLFVIVITFCNLCYYPWLQEGRAIYEIFSFALIILILNTSIQYVRYEWLELYLVRVLKTCLAFLFLQFFLTKFAGITISGILSFLPLSNLVDNQEFIEHQLKQDRFSSFFQEPAHYAEYVSILLVHSLFKNESSKYRYLIACLTTISIIISKAASGYALVFLIWSLWFLINFHTNKRRAIYILIILVFIFPFSFDILSNNDDFLIVISRVSEFSFNPDLTSNGYSTYIRTLRGYIPFWEVSFYSKLLGLGLGSIGAYSDAFPQSKFLSVTDFNPNWINGIQYLLFSSGTIGFVVFIKFIFDIILKNTIYGQVLIIMLITLMFSSSIIFSPFFILILYIAIKEKQLYSYANKD